MQFRNFSESDQLRSSQLGDAVILSYNEEEGSHDENAIETESWLERYSKSLRILLVRGHYKDKAHFRSASQSLLLRSEICHQNITPLLCFKELSNSMHLLAAYQCGSTTLQDRRVDSFKEVLKMTYHVLQALSYLQSVSRLHGDIRPSNVSYYESEELYKLNEMFVMNQKPIELNLKYAKVTKDRNVDLYMAPHVFNDILNRRLSDVKYNYYKNETFSLGMIIFAIVSRKDVQRLYNRSLRAFDMRLFRSLKEEIKMISTDSQLEQKFLRFVMSYMLNPDERQRLAPKRALNLLSKLIKKFMGGAEGENEAEDLIEGAHEGGLGEYLMQKEEGGRAVQASKEGGGEDAEGELEEEEVMERVAGEEHALVVAEAEGVEQLNAAEAVQDSGQTTSAAGIGGVEAEQPEAGEVEVIGMVKRNLQDELNELAQSMENEQVKRLIRKKKRKRKRRMLKKMAFFNLNKVQKKIKRRRRASGMFVTMLRFNKEIATQQSSGSKERDIMRRSSINPFRPRSQTLMPGIMEDTRDRLDTMSHDNRQNPFFRNRGNSLNPFMIQNTLSRKSSGTEEEIKMNPFKRGLSNLSMNSPQKVIVGSGFSSNPFAMGAGPNPNAHMIEKSSADSEVQTNSNPFMTRQVIQEEPQTPKSDSESDPTPSESSLMDNMSLKIEVKGKKIDHKQNFMFLNQQEKHQILRILKPYLTTELRDPTSRMVININSRRASAEITIVEQEELEVITQNATDEGDTIEEEEDKPHFEDATQKESTGVIDMAKMILTEMGKRQSNQQVEVQEKPEYPVFEEAPEPREQENKMEAHVQEIEHDFEIAEFGQIPRNRLIKVQVGRQMPSEETPEEEEIDYEHQVVSHQSKERSRSKTKFPTQMMISEQGRFQYAGDAGKDLKTQEQKQVQTIESNNIYQSQTPANLYYNQNPVKANNQRNFQLKSVITSIKTFKRPSVPRMPIGISQRESLKPKYVSYNQFRNQEIREERDDAPEIRESIYPLGTTEGVRDSPSFKRDADVQLDEPMSLYERGNNIPPEQTHPHTLNFQNHLLKTAEDDFQMKINKTQYPLQQLESSMIKQSVINLASQSAIPMPQDQSINDSRRNFSGYYESGGTYTQNPSDWIHHSKKESGGGTHGMISLNVTNNTNQMGDTIHESTVQLQSTNDFRMIDAEGGFKKKVNLDSRDFGFRVRSEEVGDTLKAISQFGIAKIKSEGIQGRDHQNEGGMERIISITNHEVRAAHNELRQVTKGSPGKVNQWAQGKGSGLQTDLCSPKNSSQFVSHEQGAMVNGEISKPQMTYQKVISPVPGNVERRQVLATQKKTYPEQAVQEVQRHTTQLGVPDAQITSTRTTYQKTEPRVERIRVTAEGSNVLANRSPKHYQYQNQKLRNIYRTVPVTGQTSLVTGRQINAEPMSKMAVSRTEFVQPQSTVTHSVSSQINRSNVLFKTHDSFHPSTQEARTSNTHDKMIVMKPRHMTSPRAASYTSFSRKSNPAERAKRTFTSGLKIYKRVRDAHGNIVKKNLGESIDLYCENILNKIQRESRQRVGGNLQNYASAQVDGMVGGRVLSTIPSERGISSSGKTTVTYQSSRVIPMSGSPGYYGFSGSKVQRTSSRDSGQETGYFRSNRVSPNIRTEYRSNGVSSHVKRV